MFLLKLAIFMLCNDDEHIFRFEIFISNHVSIWSYYTKYSFKIQWVVIELAAAGPAH